MITTDRLILREFVADDAPQVQRLCSEECMADTTLHIPHPYPEGTAATWIAQQRNAATGSMALAITLRDTSEVIGAVGLDIEMEHLRAELGYWIGLPWWGQGFATEAAGEALRFAFQDLGLNRVIAKPFRRNCDSRRVLAKCGMRFIVTLDQDVRKWGKFEDVSLYAILRAEWEAHSRTSAPAAPSMVPS